MWKFITFVLLLYFELSNCYNKSISLDEYSVCEKESIIGPGSHYVTSFMKFQEFVPIDCLVYGKGEQETRIKFYFQGPSHFGLALLSKCQEPEKNESLIYFQITCEYSINNEASYIFLNTGETKKCDTKKFPNFMHNVYFTELQIVINKQFGFVSVFLPNYGTSPFMTCYDPQIVSGVKYIGLTTRDINTVRYIYDCPL